MTTLLLLAATFATAQNTTCDEYGMDHDKPTECTEEGSGSDNFMIYMFGALGGAFIIIYCCDIYIRYCNREKIAIDTQTPSSLHDVGMSVTFTPAETRIDINEPTHFTSSPSLHASSTDEPQASAPSNLPASS